MPLVSTAYITNQYRRQVYQFETKSCEELPKPIYLKPLTLIWMTFRRQFRTNSKMSSAIFRPGLAPVSPTLRGALDHRFRQPQRDEFHHFWPVKDFVGIPALHQNSNSAERHPRHNRQRSQNSAEHRDVHHQLS